jgi:hypothetical protein
LSFSFVAASLRPVYCTSFAQESGIHRHTMSFAATAKTAGGELTDCAHIGAKVGRWLNAAVVDPKGDGACFSTIALQQSMRPTIRPSLDRP